MVEFFSTLTAGKASFPSLRKDRATWALAFEKVQANCPVAADLLHLCAFLAPEAIYGPQPSRRRH
jgi:hypothetical protein